MRILILILFFNLPSYAQKIGIEPYIENLTVKVVSYDDNGESQGTGIFVTSNIVITESHILRYPTVIIFKSDWNYFKSAIIISSNTLTDFALLKVESHFNNWAVFSKDFRLKDNILIIGNPIPNDFLLLKLKIDGLFSLLTPDKYRRTMFGFNHSGKMGQGFSGSGVFNMRGELIGMVELTHKVNPIGLAILSSEIIDFLKISGIKYRTAKGNIE